MLLPLYLNLNYGSVAQTDPVPGNTFESASTPNSGVVGHLVSVATAREETQVTISLSDPMVAAGAGVGSSGVGNLGPFWNEHVQSGDGLVSFDVTVQGNPSRVALEIPFTVTGADDAVHYTLPQASPLLIPAGQRTGKLWIDFIAASRWFAQREVVITLGAGTGTISRGQQLFTYILRPTAAAPVIEWDSATYSGTEEGGAIAGQINIVGTPVLDDITAYVELQAGGTATDGVDFTTQARAVVIPALAQNVPFSLTPIDEATVEANETAIFKIVNDARTSQVNLWTFSDELDEPEGPVFQTITNAGRPTDNVYVDDSVEPTGWAVSPIAARNTPDGRKSGSRYGVTSLCVGSARIGKSANASTGDDLGQSVGGADQNIGLTAENCLSVYVRRPDVQLSSKYFGLDIYDQVTLTHHRVRFEWTGSTPSVVSGSEEGSAVGGIQGGAAWAHATAANDWHRAYIQYTAPSGEQGNLTMRYLESYSDYDGEVVELNRNKGVEFAWPQYEQGVTTPTAYQRCNGSHWFPWGSCTQGTTTTTTFTITNTDV